MGLEKCTAAKKCETLGIYFVLQVQKADGLVFNFGNSGVINKGNKSGVFVFDYSIIVTQQEKKNVKIWRKHKAK